MTYLSLLLRINERLGRFHKPAMFFGEISNNRRQTFSRAAVPTLKVLNLTRVKIGCSPPFAVAPLKRMNLRFGLHFSSGKSEKWIVA